MTQNYRVSLVAIIIFLLFGCAEADSDGWLAVPNHQYVLISRSFDGSDNVDYAAVKITQQGLRADDSLRYEWVALNLGESKVSVGIQNYRAGNKNTVGRFGIGFEGYRFSWEAVDGSTQGRIRPVWHGVEGVRFCLSDFTEVWGRDLQMAIEELDKQGRCH